MRALLFVLLVLGLLLLVGCCKSWEQPQPIKPASVLGWSSTQSGTLRVLGEFVLKEGESTESKSEAIGIQVLEISPRVQCLGYVSEPPRKEVKLRIYRPSDGRTLCETTESEGSGDLHCGNQVLLPTSSINGINTKERWVWFSLVETAPADK